jgi:uncharacterized membrane protein
VKKLITGLVLALAGFGITYFNTLFTTIVGLILMVVGVALLFWSLAQARSKKKG